MSRRANLTIVLLFAVFLGAFFVGNILYPDQVFSPQENRYLQTAPPLTLSSLFKGEFTSKAEKYGSDQFIFRDQWISWKARLELLQGKKSNNGIFLCAEEQLLEPFRAPDEAVLDQKLGYIETLAENVPVPVTLALIPSAAEIYREKLPSGVINDSQADVLRYIAENSPVETVDIISSLSSHRDEYIFYRTDHHWTTLGAFYGYQALAEALQLTAHDDSFYSPQTVSEEFCGTAYSSSGFFWIEPDEMQIFLEQPEELSVVRYEKNEPEGVSLYDYTALETKDKYRFFLGGNTPRAVIRTGNEDRPSLLILRDSYADSLVPFLLESYSEIHLLDLRYYLNSVSDYVQEQEIDSVLILYSLPNFCSDTNLALLTR